MFSPIFWYLNISILIIFLPHTEIKQKKMSIATFKRLANSDANIKKGIRNLNKLS